MTIMQRTPRSKLLLIELQLARIEIRKLLLDVRALKQKFVLYYRYLF